MLETQFKKKEERLINISYESKIYRSLNIVFMLIEEQQAIHNCFLNNRMVKTIRLQENFQDIIIRVNGVQQFTSLGSFQFQECDIEEGEKLPHAHPKFSRIIMQDIPKCKFKFDFYFNEGKNQKDEVKKLSEQQYLKIASDYLISKEHQAIKVVIAEKQQLKEIQALKMKKRKTTTEEKENKQERKGTQLTKRKQTHIFNKRSTYLSRTQNSMKKNSQCSSFDFLKFDSFMPVKNLIENLNKERKVWKKRKQTKQFCKTIIVRKLDHHQLRNAKKSQTTFTLRHISTSGQKTKIDSFYKCSRFEKGKPIKQKSEK